MQNTIQPPPLSQSMYEAMACPASYQAQQVYGIKSPANEFSELGLEVHRCLSLYTQHLHAKGICEDWAYFTSILPSFTAEAQTILKGFIGSMRFDPESILTTEVRLTFDDAAGTPDLVTMESPTAATIWDYKNYFEMIEADTFQSKLYPLLLFRDNPYLETVRFVLVFVRYGKTREVIWTRDQVPYLESVLASARARQLALHEASGLAQAVPGKQCEYCPLLRTRQCQLNETNPYSAMNAEDRLSYVIFLRSALRNNMTVLRDQARLRMINVSDANGKQYEAGFLPAERRTLPLLPALKVLEMHFDESGEDLTGKACISRTSLASLRNAKKRVLLDQALSDIEAVKETTAFKITRVNPETPEEEYAGEHAER